MLRGLSEKLLASHHQNNYGGAVKRLNAIRAQLAATPFASTPGFQLNGLKREELIASNSMLLHELYFASLGGDGQSMEPAMALALAASFGSAERWREEFAALGKALGGGSGWVLLAFQPREGTLVNQWAADHTHALAGATPILALDMYEHAYHLDHGAAAGAYVDAFMDNIHWGQVYARYQQAVHAASEPSAPRRTRSPDRCCSTCAAPGCSSGPPRCFQGRAGAIRPRSTAGPPNCRPAATWWCIASMATRWGAALPCGCARQA